MSGVIKTYAKFWPFYLREHSKPGTRAWHYAGTTGVFILLAAAGWTREPRCLIAALVSGYGCAWIGHFMIQKNVPATFTYPLWSFVSDFRMYFVWLSGGLGTHLKNAGIRT